MTDAVGDRTLVELLDVRAATAPDATALVVESTGGHVVELTYARFHELVGRVAAGLLARGVRPGERVLVQLPNSVEMALAWFGVVRLGAVFVPSNTANTAREVRHLAARADVALGICQPDVVALFAEADPQRLGSGRVVTVGGPVDGPAEDDPAGEAGLGELLAAEPIGPMRRPRADDLVELVFTSGTTAAPKAAMITHANCVFSGLQKAAAMELDADERLLTTLPLFHVNAQSALLAGLCVGAPMVLLESYSAARFCAQLAAHDATVTSLVSTQVRTLLRQPVSEAHRAHRVRRAWFALDISAGERREFEARFGIRLLNGYGLTEAYTSVCQAPLHGEDRWPAVGLPLLGREVRTVDADGLDVPDGEVGEIIVKGTPGRTVMAGYWGDPDATARTLRDGWLHTGDSGRLDERGHLHFVDRKADLIKRAGENIAAAEVEAVLLTHPAVAEVAVVGVSDPVRDEAVLACVVLASPGAGSDAAVADGPAVLDELAQHARRHLAPFKVPTVWELLDELPRTSIGKVRKDDLRTSFAGRHPDGAEAPAPAPAGEGSGVAR